ncbi:MAG: ATP-binding protein [Desulfovibrio sp.]|nr:ATP-binding protein [Desulfovibrio sp.]
MFKKAERKQAKLRLALSGPSGSGKTTGALLIAKGLGGKIAVLDTERGSASLYADLCEFDVVELAPPYEPERYIEIIRAAEKEGYSTLILDSITHEWNGQGGILEIVDNVAKAKFRGNSYAAWNEGTPRHQKFIDAMLASSLHIIATMRSKAVYVETEKGNGKKGIEKQGTAPQQRDGLEYEFTAVLDLNVDGNLAVASKDRTRLFHAPFKITEQTGQDLLAWLNCGVPFSEQAKTQNPSPMTPDQSKALMAYLTKRHGNDRAAYLAELSSFFGRPIASSRELTKADVSEFLDAVNSGREAA